MLQLHILAMRFGIPGVEIWDSADEVLCSGVAFSEGMYPLWCPALTRRWPGEPLFPERQPKTSRSNEVTGSPCSL